MVPWDGRKLANLGPGRSWNGSWVVKHSKAGFTRKRRGKLSAGTQQLDRQWEHAKGAVPKQWTTKRLGKIKEKELWAYLYQGYWRRQVSGSLFHKLGQLCAETRWSPKKKKGVLQLAQWNLMTRGVFNRKKSFFDRVTRNFDCHVFEKFHRCSWNTHEGCKFEWDVWKWLIWVCLKIGYIPNYSNLIGIMIINHWV